MKGSNWRLYALRDSVTDRKICLKLPSHFYMTISCIRPFPSLAISLRVKIHETETRLKKRGGKMTIIYTDYLLEREVGM